MEIKLPRWSPIWNLALCAHLLSESDSEDGTFHASILPPTKISIAAEKPKRRNKSKREQAEALVVEEPAMVITLDMHLFLALFVSQRCRQSEGNEKLVLQSGVWSVCGIYGGGDGKLAVRWHGEWQITMVWGPLSFLFCCLCLFGIYSSNGTKIMEKWKLIGRLQQVLWEVNTELFFSSSEVNTELIEC